LFLWALTSGGVDVYFAFSQTAKHSKSTLTSMNKMKQLTRCGMLEIAHICGCDNLDEIYSGERPIPSLSSAVGLVASVLANEIILFITGKRHP
jgi:hypothetical protein